LLKLPWASHLISQSFLTILAIIFTLILVPRCFSAQITVIWDENSEIDIAGYKMHYGTTRGNYEYSVDVGNNTSCSISGLTEGTTYYLAATAYNTNNVESSFSEELVHTIASQPPVADLEAMPVSGVVPLMVTFDASGSSDANGTISNYSWNFGDGSIGSGMVTNHTYTDAGQYTAVLTVTDDAGATDNASVVITVESVITNNPPTVSIISPANGASFDSSTIISFDGTASDNEDGDLTSGLVWTSDLQGQIATAGSFTTVLSEGIHTITAEVTDSGDSTASDSIPITVSGGSDDGFTLGVYAYKVKGDKYADLTWSGATSTNVNVYRDNSQIETTDNDGAYTHGPFGKGKPATYQVCEVGTSTCSNTVSVSW
jgi:PKD repeat protein